MRKKKKFEVKFVKKSIFSESYMKHLDQLAVDYVTIVVVGVVVGDVVVVDSVMNVVEIVIALPLLDDSSSFFSLTKFFTYR